jgi:hypothetical protein
VLSLNRHALCGSKSARIEPDRSPESLTVAGMPDQSDQQLLATCMACAAACLRCGKACADYPELRNCERACRGCFIACVLLLADLRDGGRLRTCTRLACALACEACAAKCGRQRGARLDECAAACRACAEACRHMGTDLPSSNLSTLSRSRLSAPPARILINDSTDTA